MLNLKDPNISYILISSDNINNLTSYLYSREYYLLDIKGYCHEKFENSLIAFSEMSNNDLRKDAIHIMTYFGQENLIIKYKDEVNPKRIYENGSEQPLGIIMYNTDIEKISYIYEGVSFSFVEQQLYYFPKKSYDFKTGMVVECFSNNKWVEKKVVNPELEFNKMYNLLMKYNKIRIPV